MNYIYGKDRKQMEIGCLEDLIEKDNEVRVIDALIDALDIESLGFEIGNNNATGRPSFDPRDMIKLYVYGYFYGIRSSRKLARQAIINRELAWLINGLQPKYRVIAEFRKNNIEALQNIFESFVDYCIKLGLYGKELIAVDGIKVEASASKRKNYSRNKLVVMKKKAQERINEYLQDLNNIDLLEDNSEAEFTKEKIQAALNALEEKKKYYEEIESKLDAEDINEINFTDPDAKTMKFGATQGTDLGYNLQTAVDEKNNLIVTFDISTNSADQGQLYTMSSKAKEKLDVETIEVLADKGYFDVNDLKKCEENGIVTYVAKPRYSNSIGDSRYFSDRFKYDKNSNTYTCPDGQVLSCITKKIDANQRKYVNYDACEKCSNKYKCTTSKKGRTITRKATEDIAELVNERTKNNREKFSKRKSIVEHPFGTIKRSMNFYYLLLRGLRKVGGEVSIAFFTYNLKRVMSIIGNEKLLLLLKGDNFLKSALKSINLIILILKIKLHKILIKIQMEIQNFHLNLDISCAF